MPGLNNVCPKCGYENTDGAKFCRKCGVKLVPSQPSTADTLEKVSEIARTVSSTVSKVETTIGTAGKIAQTAKELSEIVIRPPAEWKVVVGDVLPATGEKLVESAVQTAGKEVQQQVQQKVQAEVIHQVSEILSKPKPDIERYSAPSILQPELPPAAMASESVVLTCSKCGKTIKPGAKFCGGCGAGIGTKVAEKATPPDIKCPSCGKPLTPGKKFCGSCGFKIQV